MGAIDECEIKGEFLVAKIKEEKLKIQSTGKGIKKSN